MSSFFFDIFLKIFSNAVGGSFMDTQKSKNRPNNATLLQRRKIGLQIIKDKKYKLSVEEFKKEYTKRLQKELTTSTSRGKMKRDIDWIIGEVRKDNPSFEFTTKPLRKSSEKVNIMPLAYFEKDITEIHLTFADRTNVIIFDTEHKQLGLSSFVDEAKEHIPEVLPADSLIVLRIFFNPMAYRGIETVICDIYDRAPDFAPLNIVSTLARHRCAEIETKKADISPVLEFTYKLLNRYWKNRVEKAKNKRKKEAKSSN